MQPQHHLIPAVVLDSPLCAMADRSSQGPAAQFSARLPGALVVAPVRESANAVQPLTSCWLDIGHDNWRTDLPLHRGTQDACYSPPRAMLTSRSLLHPEPGLY
jgi:hypothetical protein